MTKTPEAFATIFVLRDVDIYPVLVAYLQEKSEKIMCP